MNGKIVYETWITREAVQAAPEDRWVFGDNSQRVGLGGQAGAMRGEPNAIGIATKWTPGGADADFFKDGDDKALTLINSDIRQIITALGEGRTVHLPADGLGTGLSELPTRAPGLHNHILRRFHEIDPACPWPKPADTKPATFRFKFKMRYSWADPIEVEIGAEFEARPFAEQMAAALKVVLGLHQKWRSGEKGGVRASLDGASLDGASLNRASLNRASLNGASLNGASLNRASLNDASLNGASLNDASLNGASLNRASLDGASLDGASLNDASLNGASLNRASLNGASLNGASLNDASLNGASLNRASLNGASLNGASLNGASLNRASLNGASGLTIERTSPLAMLRYQPGPIRAFKVLNSNDEGHYNGGLQYPMGEQVEVLDANTDPGAMCVSGIHVASLDWCLKEWVEGRKIAVMEFSAVDIAAIPIGTDGKFRLFRCRRVEDIPQSEIDRMLGRKAV